MTSLLRKVPMKLRLERMIKGWWHIGKGKDKGAVDVGLEWRVFTYSTRLQVTYTDLEYT